MRQMVNFEHTEVSRTAERIIKEFGKDSVLPENEQIVKHFLNYLRTNYGPPEQVLTQCGDLLRFNTKKKIDRHTAETVRNLFQSYYDKKHKLEQGDPDRTPEIGNIVPTISDLMRLALLPTGMITKQPYSNSKISQAFEQQESITALGVYKKAMRIEDEDRLEKSGVIQHKQTIQQSSKDLNH